MGSSSLQRRSCFLYNPQWSTLRPNAPFENSFLCKTPQPQTKIRSNPHSNHMVIRATGRVFGQFFTNNVPDAETRDLLPSSDILCPCGSERPYGKCCRRFHTAQGFPQLAEELLRSRYSAYAYRLPSYIMKTTHSSLAELDRRKWKREILEFCADYQFVGGIDIIEQQITGPYSARILFRANLMQRNSPLSFLEMATFARERNVWYYKNGKLVDIDDQG